MCTCIYCMHGQDMEPDEEPAESIVRPEDQDDIPLIADVHNPCPKEGTLNHPKIVIQPSPTADTRICDFFTVAVRKRLIQ